MQTLKSFFKKLPVIPSIYRALRHKYDRYQLSSRSSEDIFTEYYKNNAWGGKVSVSGRGSDFDQTKIIIDELPKLLRDFNISNILDIPCGDFHWMKSVNLNGIDYTGADIVEELILENTGKYANKHTKFRHLNLIGDTLPKVDLVFCRDCLVHLSFKDIFLALDNICSSQSEYLLTTTFIQAKENSDITTGQWRTLNLQLAPFFLPKPLRIVVEECPERNGVYRDKALALWRVSNIYESLVAPK